MWTSVYFLKRVFFLILHLILYKTHDAELEIRSCKDFTIFMYARVCQYTHAYTRVCSDTFVCTCQSEVFIGRPISFWSEWSGNVHSFIWQNVLYNSWAKLFSCVLCHITRQSIYVIVYDLPVSYLNKGHTFHRGRMPFPFPKHLWELAVSQVTHCPWHHSLSCLFCFSLFRCFLFQPQSL